MLLNLNHADLVIDTPAKPPAWALNGARADTRPDTGL